MGRLRLGFVHLVLPLSLIAQSPIPPESRPSDPVQVFTVGSSVTMPTLQGSDFSSLIAKKCESKFSGKTELAMIVDTKGKAQDVQFVSPAANDADRLAVYVALMENFSPGSNGANPVPVAVAIEMKIEGCVAKVQGHGPSSNYQLELRKVPTQVIKPYNGFPDLMQYAPEFNIPALDPKFASKAFKVGRGISMPTPISTPEAPYSDEARRKKINGVCLITLFVDPHGLAQRPEVLRSLEPSLDQQALYAVNRYRFKPAMKAGVQPVPVLITIEVNFQLY